MNIKLNHERNLFVQKPDQYLRNLNILEEANATTAHYLSLKFSKPYEECLKFVNGKTNKGEIFEPKPITLTGLRQQENGDRILTNIKVDKFLNIVKKSNHILSPNVVMYANPKIRKSPIVNYIKNKKAKRKVIKKRGQEAEQLKNYTVYSACNNEEYAVKLMLNSISGAHISPHNPLVNPSAHSTLTSITRVSVSYPNAIVERFLMGNRHYWSKDIVIENILTITRNTNYIILKSVVEKYNVHIPTVDEIMVMIKSSIKYYWKNNKDLESIVNLLEKLNDLQRVAFLYTGDFFSLYTHNNHLISNFFDDFLNVKNWFGNDDPCDTFLDDIIKSASSGVASLAAMYCMEFFKGNTLGKIKETNRDQYKQYANTVLHIEYMMIQYKDLLTCFYRTNNLPSSIYAFPSSIRKAVAGSDTDSVIYSVQQQVIWRYGKLVFGEDVSKFTNTVAFLTNSVVDNSLGCVAKQMGAVDEELFTLMMKNEYEFLVYLKANRAKHYATLMAAKEGIVFKDFKVEIRGVGLKDSKIPKKVMKALEEEIVKAMKELVNTSSIEVLPIAQRIANLEHSVLKELETGSIKYLTTVNINAKEGYKNPAVSNYVHYELWDAVFSKKFGSISPPPYSGIKISTVVNKKAKFNKWVQTIDPIIGEPLVEWMKQRNRDEFKQFILPLEIVSNGLPKDFLNIMDTRSIIASISAPYYILLEMLGIYMDNEDDTQLVSDRLPYREEYGIVGEKHLE